MAVIELFNRRTQEPSQDPEAAASEDLEAQREPLTVGQEASLSRTITTELIEDFARVSGDRNPVHLDEEYAKRTRFGGRIAHGMLVGSLISAVLGMRLPGPGAIYLGQQIRFLAPVRPGDTVTARVRVIDWDAEKRRVTLLTDVVNDHGVTVASGEATLLVPAAEAAPAVLAAAA